MHTLNDVYIYIYILHGAVLHVLNDVSIRVYIRCCIHACIRFMDTLNGAFMHTLHSAFMHIFNSVSVHVLCVVLMQW